MHAETAKRGSRRITTLRCWGYDFHRHKIGPSVQGPMGLLLYRQCSRSRRLPLLQSQESPEDSVGVDRGNNRAKVDEIEACAYHADGSETVSAVIRQPLLRDTESMNLS